MIVNDGAMNVRLRACKNIADLRLRARKKLPAPMFHYIDGGSDDEWTMHRSTAAFEEWQLIPDCLEDVSRIDLRTRLLGKELDLPLVLSPTGMTRLFHRDKEIGVCRAAEKHGAAYSLSTLATTSLEKVSEHSGGPKIFQIYIFKDRGLTRELIQRCKASGFDALCLTVDTPLGGNRERDIVNGMTIPPRISLRNALSYASSFEWLLHLVLSPGLKLENVAHRADALGKGTVGLVEYVNDQLDRSVTWDDAAALVEEWDGPFILKGLLSGKAARRAMEIGVSALMISNHGGRQLEATPAPIDSLPHIRDAIGGEMELIVDGGIRRGTHVIKALALGANACAIGRPYLYGLAAGGQAGVERSIEILRAEIERSMALLGVSSVEEIDASHICRVGPVR